MKWLNFSLSALNCDFPAQIGNTFSTLSNVQRNTRTQQHLTKFPKCDVKHTLFNPHISPAYILWDIGKQRRQIRRHKMRRLIMVFTVCLQK